MGIQAILANKIAHNEQSQNLRLAMAADEFPYLLKGPLDEEGEHLRIALRIAEPLYGFSPKSQLKIFLFLQRNLYLCIHET